MARIRSIHPGFWTDVATLQMSIEANLFLIGLWGESDDGGAFAWQPIQLKAKIMPMRPAIDVETILDELSKLDVICSYEVDGKRYGAIRNFGKWQSPKKPNRKYPMPGEIVQFCGTENIPVNEVTSEEKRQTSIKECSHNILHQNDTSFERVLHQFPTGSEPVPLGRGGGRGKEEDILSPLNPPKGKVVAPPESKKPIIPDWIPVDAWNGWVEMRKRKKAPLTPRAAELTIHKLEGFRKQGYDVGSILDTSTERGWTGVFEPKNVVPFNPNHRPKPSSNPFEGFDDAWHDDLDVHHSSPYTPETTSNPCLAREVRL